MASLEEPAGEHDAKGKRSFEVLGELDPEALKPHLPSFARMVRILNENL